MSIRPADTTDIEQWSKMRHALWPDSLAVHRREIEDFFANRSRDIRQCFLIEAEGNVAGFIELNIRNYAKEVRMLKCPMSKAGLSKPPIAAGDLVNS